VLARRLGDGDAAEHPRNFFDSLGALQIADPGLRSFAIALLANLQMLCAKGRYLWKMRHAQHLRAARKRSELAANDLGDSATDTRIYFVKDHAGGGVRIARRTRGERDLHGE